MKFIFFIFIILFCKENKDFLSNVEIVRMEKVQTEKDGKLNIADVEISYFECPGTQYEIIRGGKEFSECIFSNYKIGDKVKVDINWKWDSFGYYKWQVKKVGLCERIFDPLDEASYDLIEECEDYKIYDAKVGFTCRRIPTSNLIQKCPWFRKK
jgi:hypothetical protein